MIQLIPLEETVAGKELIQMGMEQGMERGIQEGIKKGIRKGRKEGKKEGIEKGELIGRIQMALRILKYPVTSKAELISKEIKELKVIVSKLESELNQNFQN